MRVMIITGAGNAFVSGADINELLGYDSISGWAASRFQQSVLNRLEKMGKPSIAAINGFAMGEVPSLPWRVPFGSPPRGRA